MFWLRIVRIPCRFVEVGVVPAAVVPVFVIVPPVRAACSSWGVGCVMPSWPNCCLANAKEMNTFPKPILPVGGLIIVVDVTGTAGAPGVALGVDVVLVSVMGVPFLSPLTTALESEPRKELNSPLILPTTLLSPWVAPKVFILPASVFKSVVV